MARYYLDSGVVIGFTFLHDLWQTEADRIFSSGNSFYLTEPVLFEYCNRSNSNCFETASVDWETEKGRFGDIISNVEGAATTLDMKLWSYRDDEINVGVLVDDFLDEIDPEDKLDDELVDEYVRPNIRDFIEDELGEDELTVEKSRNIMDILCDTIEDEARDRRKWMKRETNYPEVPDPERERFKSKVEGVVKGKMDSIIVGDAGFLQSENVLSNLITTDKNHIYSNRDRIEAEISVVVQYVKDKLSDPKIQY